MANQMTAVLEQAIHTLSARAEESALDDRELLLRFAENNDQSAFAVLVQRYSGIVLGVCRRSLANVQDAEDACQATFLVLARKAAAGRWRLSLANWLYTTARQVASNARLAARRRTRRESQVVPPETVDPAEQMTGRELMAALDEELDRLHARYREPLVLCYLQGLTRDEAAARLGIPPATVKTRLERGRQRLHDALTRRGCTLGAGLLALTVVGPARATSPYLVKAILATVGGSPSLTVAELARGAIVNAFMQRLLRVTLVAAAVIACLGVGVWAAWPAVGGQSAPKEQPANAETPNVKPKPPAEEKGRTISGRVVDRAGKPVAKAAIVLAGREAMEGPTVRELAMTDDDGRFRCVIPPPGQLQLLSDYRLLVARARGYAADWIAVKDADSSQPVVLRLGTAKIQVRGRVLTLEGKPIPNARVRIMSLQALDEKDGLKKLYQSWNERRVTGLLNEALYHTAAAGLPQELRADTQGRFEITGVGDGHVLRLEFSADTIETVAAGVVVDPAFDGKSVRVNPPGIDPNTSRPYTNSPLYGPTFDHAAKPGRVIQGHVFDQKTKKPLANVAITGLAVGRSRWVPVSTDTAGRFRITGLPNAECEVMFNSYSSNGTPYLTLTKTVGPTPGLAPANVELPLVRGTVVTGRVTNKKTGKPIKSGISYFTLSGNNHVLDLPGKDVREAVTDLDDDGRFRFVAPPGLGILAVRIPSHMGWEKFYPPARIDAADRKKPYFQSNSRLVEGFLNTENRIHPFRGFFAYRVIEPAVGTESLRVDIQLDPGKTVAGKVVGPDGQSVIGVTITGLSDSRMGAHTLTGASFTVQAVIENDARTVIALHAEKKLVGSIVVRGDEKEPLVLRLSGWGAVTGRIVSKDGVPLAGATVRLRYKDQTAAQLNNRLTRRQPVKSDAAGKFRIDAPFAGIEFTLLVRHKSAPVFHQIPGGTVKPGQTKALGDVVLKEKE